MYVADAISRAANLDGVDALSWGSAVAGNRWPLVIAVIPPDPGYQPYRRELADYFMTTIRTAVAPGGTLLHFYDGPCWLDKLIYKMVDFEG